MIESIIKGIIKRVEAGKAVTERERRIYDAYMGSLKNGNG